MASLSITLRLPPWVDAFLSANGDVYPSLRERMLLAIELSRLNSENRTGGPFGAAIFEQKSGNLVAVGVNTVLINRCSIAHAEIVAIAFAQQNLGSYDLGAPSLQTHELVTSSEPCAMCFGAILWAGMHRMICGARSEDVCAIGFDEGPKPSNWISALETRGISVQRDICRQEARAVLDNYAVSGGEIYNARQHNPDG
jgi:tRNA(Arg) A34 adenosine deaminase TadA